MLRSPLPLVYQFLLSPVVSLPVKFLHLPKHMLIDPNLEQTGLNPDHAYGTATPARQQQRPDALVAGVVVAGE